MGKPGPNDIIGFDEYCREPTCQWHIVAIRTSNGTAAPEPVKRCPQNHEAGVTAIPIRGSLPLPDEAGPVHQVLILPAKPYGGFVLQLGDEDASKRWEGGVAQPLVARPPSDPIHLGARYVAELQRDLIQLGYLSEARWERPGGPHPQLVFEKGKVTMPVVAALLTLKADLAKASTQGGYQVPSKGFLQGRGEAASPDKSPMNPDVKAPFPIFFDPKLRNPRTVTVKWDNWGKFFNAADVASQAWNGMKAHIVYPRKINVSFSLPPDAPGQPKDEKSVAVASMDEELRALEAARKELVQFEQAATAPARKQAIARGIDVIQRRGDTLQNGFAKDVSGLAAKLHEAVSELSKDADSATAVLSTMTARALVVRSTIDWQLQNDRAKTQKDLTDSIKAEHQKLKDAVHAGIDDPSGKLAKIVAVCDDVVATIKGAPALANLVNDQVTTMANDAKVARAKLAAFVDAVDNVDFDTGMQQYRTDVREFGRVDLATALCIKKMIAERQLNGRLSYVGPEENEIIEWDANVTLADGTKVNRKIGRTKLTNDPAFCEAALRQAAIEVLPDLQPMFPNVAFKILHAMLFNESGWVQFGGNFEGFHYITMGIDWGNVATPEGSGLKLLVFDEFATGIPSYAVNRGWGLSQNSAGDSGDFSRSLGFVRRVQGQASEDHSGEKVSFKFFNSLPLPVSDDKNWPATLTHPKAALAFTMNLVISNFSNSVKKVPCTFPSAEQKSFDCAKCLARFVTRPVRDGGDFIDTEQLKRVFPFEADIAAKAQAGFLAGKTANSEAERQQLLESPAGKKAVQDAYDAQDTADRDAAKTEAEAQLAKRLGKNEKNVPTIDEFMKTPDFELIVARRRLAAQTAFKPEKGSVPALPEVSARAITTAITPTAFARVFGRHPTTALECVEQPCSWLAARAFYAGRVPEGITHAAEVARDVIRLSPKPSP
jgi:hypothetical protein